MEPVTYLSGLSMVIAGYMWYVRSVGSEYVTYSVAGFCSKAGKFHIDLC